MTTDLADLDAAGLLAAATEAERAARLAESLDRVLVTLVDTPGAEPGAEAEAGGVAEVLAMRRGRGGNADRPAAFA